MIENKKSWLSKPGAGIVQAVIILMGALLIVGCSMGKYARLEVSRQVVRDFESYQIYPGHRYFYLKQENAPYAIIALRDEYTISSSNWYELDTGSDEFPATVDFARSVAMERFFPLGFIILSPQGNQIGYWYSGLRIKGVAVNNEMMTVSIFTETPWLDYDRL